MSIFFDFLIHHKTMFSELIVINEKKAYDYTVLSRRTIVRWAICKDTKGTLYLSMGDHDPNQWSHINQQVIDEDIVILTIFSSQTVDFIVWFKHYWYTTYKKTLWLFFPFKKHSLLQIAQHKKRSSTHIIWDEQQYCYYEDTKKKKTWQTLIVFPDLRTLINKTSTRDQKNVHICHSQQTDLQKIKNFNAIQNGSRWTILSTPSQIFFDWHHIKHIEIVDPRRRYYKNQQNPRYSVPTICKKIAEIRWCTYHERWLFTWEEY
jgi:primosomal protein N'